MDSESDNLQIDKLDDKKRIMAWSLYDWANSSFATTVMAGFLPVFLSAYWAPNLSNQETDFLLGWANSAASLVVVVIAPILGAIADQMAGKKKFLAFFCFLGALMSIVLGFLSTGQYLLAMVIYGIGILGFSGANIFYDSLLPAVASEKKIDYVSSLGYSLGYIGGGLLFTLNVALYLLADMEVIPLSVDLAVKISFISVGIWWILFSIPIFKRVPEPYIKDRVSASEAIRGGFRQLVNTFKDIRKLKYVGLFLLAFWLYIDGVDTIIRMALKYGDSLEAVDLGATELIIILLMVQFIAFPGTLFYNWFSQKIGIKNGLLVAIGGYCLITTLGYFVNANWHFYVLGGMIGLFQGGIQALSRSLYSRLIPKSKAAEFYGFFNMWGKFAAVLGPAMMGSISLVTGEAKYGLLSLLLLFIPGAIILFFVNIEKGEQLAIEFEKDFIKLQQDTKEDTID